MKEKEELRKKIRIRIKGQKESERRKRSRAIQKEFFSKREFLESKCVMLYVSRGTGEVETGPIIKKALEMGKKVVVPVTLVKEKNIKPVYLRDLRERLVRSTYGIYEPLESVKKRPVRIKDIDLVAVPGLAFDRSNNRLGHGHGYYDNFLSQIPADTPKIGLGFRFQMLKSIPSVKKDISLTSVITD
ncbi:MAG: 5-formyltetrahydrofolate cyclo-ligase [Candidatus Omnitrophota bacterium]